MTYQLWNLNLQNQGGAAVVAENPVNLAADPAVQNTTPVKEEEGRERRHTGGNVSQDRPPGSPPKQPPPLPPDEAAAGVPPQNMTPPHSPTKEAAGQPDSKGKQILSMIGLISRLF